LFVLQFFYHFFPNPAVSSLFLFPSVCLSLPASYFFLFYFLFRFHFLLFSFSFLSSIFISLFLYDPDPFTIFIPFFLINFPSHSVSSLYLSLSSFLPFPLISLAPRSFYISFPLIFSTLILFPFPLPFLFLFFSPPSAMYFSSIFLFSSSLLFPSFFDFPLSLYLFPLHLPFLSVPVLFRLGAQQFFDFTVSFFVFTVAHCMKLSL
jgi:hypothetical protein